MAVLLERDWWLKANPTLQTADSQGREACFQLGLKCFAELRPLVLHRSVTCKWLNKSRPLSYFFPPLCPLGSPSSVSPLHLSLDSCCYCEMQQVRPFHLRLCLSDFKDWPQDLPRTFPWAWGVVLLLMASFRLSQYFKSLISCERCTMCLSWPDEVFISPGDSLEIPNRAAGLVGNVALSKALPRNKYFLFVLLIGFLTSS